MMRMKRVLCLFLCTALAWASAVGETTISDFKVTPIPPWGLAIDYNVNGTDGKKMGLSAVVTIANGGTTNVAKKLIGQTDCAEGAHRIYWNMVGVGLSLDVTNATVTVAYTNYPTYCVIDLSGGADAESYQVDYLNSEPSRPSEKFTNSVYKTTKLVLKRVEAGTFIMGKDQSDESHRVILTKPFYMGIYEVTQKQWELVMGSNPSCFSDDGDMKPVEQVSYAMIRGPVKGAKWPASNEVDGELDDDEHDSFLGRLRRRTGLSFDLPTTAQWEYACRARTTTAYSYGDDANGDYMWYWDNTGSESYGTREVGTKKASPWGFYDMHGNVDEWCLDWWSSSYGSGTDPVGSTTGSHRTYCGGSYLSPDYNCGSCSANYGGSYHDDSLSSTVGFRLSRTLP